MSDLINSLADISTFEAQTSRQPVKFSILFKANLKLQYLLRRRFKTYFVMYILSILMTLFFLLLSFMPVPGTDDDQHPIPFDYSNSLEATRLIFSRNSSILYITSKSDQTSKYISEQMFKAKNYEIISDIKNLSTLVQRQNTEYSTMFGLSIDIDPIPTQITAKSDQLNSISFTTINPLINLYSPVTFINSIYKYFSNKYLNNTEVKMLSRSYSKPPSKMVISSQFISIIYFIIAHILIVVSSTTVYFIINSNKSLFLLEINGITSKVRFYVNLVVLIIEHLPIDLISTVLFCFVGKMSKGTNFLLFFVSEYLFTLSLYAIQIFFQPLLHSKGSSSAFGSLLILYSVLFEYFILFMDKIPQILNKIFLFLFSPASFSYMCCLMIKRKDDLGAMSWSSLDYEINGISGWFALIAQLIGTFVLFLLAIIGHLCNANCYGKPQLGWRNLFKIGAWKRMLSKSKQRPLIQSMQRQQSIEENLMNLENENFDNTRNLFELDDLNKTYKSRRKEVKALDSVSLTVSNGEFIVALGSNGSGKTTLISSLIGAIDVDEGSILFHGKELKNDFDEILYPELGVVFQENVLFDQLTMKEHFELFGRLSGFGENQIKSDMNNLVTVLKMSNMINTSAENLSGGNKRKLCVALSLLKKPTIVIMDEPTAGVDAQSRQLIWKVLNEFSGATVFTTCHSVEECESISSRLVLMSRGQIAFVGTAAELREKYNCCYFVSIIERNDVDMQKVLDCANEIPEMQGKVKICPEHHMTLMVPNNLYFSDVLNHIEDNKEKLGITKYTVQVENLEETMRKIIEDDEALIQQ